MALKILITNDDGIQAEGIKILVEAAKKYGDILVVAPKTEQSAKSHSITLRTKIEVGESSIFGDVKAYYVDSTPADCVRYAYYGLNYDFDILLSGINKGYNVGHDIMYSGTVAAAFEASSMEKKAIALSCDGESFKGFLEYADKILEFIKDKSLLNKWNLYNINIPINPQGIKITQQGYCNFVTYFVECENGKKQVGDNITDSKYENIFLDTSCVMNNYISVTPLTHERTEKNIYKLLKEE